MIFCERGGTFRRRQAAFFLQLIANDYDLCYIHSNWNDTRMSCGRRSVMHWFPHNDEGQGLVEYALILVLVAVVVIVILALLGPAIGNIFSNIIDSLNTAA